MTLKIVSSDVNALPIVFFYPMRIFGGFRVGLQKVDKQLEIKAYAEQDSKAISLLLRLRPGLFIFPSHCHLSPV